MDVIFDIDGTLLDISHRLHIIGPGVPLMARLDQSSGTVRAHPTNGKRWKEFRAPELKKLDSPITPVIFVMNALHCEGHKVIIASGRIRSEETDTRESLEVLVPYVQDIPFFMRSDSDYRPDYEMKLGLLQKIRSSGYNPVIVFDDRPSVIRMWRREGLLVADVGKGKEF
jgi:phosphoglycolate phosphatase-like HAD superfamily hydrolase